MRESSPNRVADRWFLIAAPVVFLCVVSLAAVLLRSGTARAPAPQPTPASPTSAALEASFTGTIRARNLVLVAAPIDGTIEIVEVEAGTDVFEGQVLARIRNASLETARKAADEELERAQSRVNNLESSLIAARLEASRAAADADRIRLEFDKNERILQRQQMLYREGATARLTYEKAQKDAASSRAEHESVRQVARQSEERVTLVTKELELVKKLLEEKKTEQEAAIADLQAAAVHAPVDGLLLVANVKAGDEVDMGMKDLFQIAVQATELEIPLEADPKTATRLHDGLAALVQILEVSPDGVQGEVRRKESGEFVAEFKSTGTAIRPGMSAIVKVRLADGLADVSLPPAAERK